VKKCPSCEAENGDGAKFCSECSVKFGAAGEAGTGKAKETPAPAPAAAAAADTDDDDESGGWFGVK